MIPSLLTVIAIALFAGGVRSLLMLRQLGTPTKSERADPFFNFVGLLFSTAHRSVEFRSVQRRAIWLFCSAMLLLYIARITFIQSDSL